ncbi:MAG: DUF4870 domain-containing protein [Cellulosilyticaceae bacterium]
MDEIRVFSEQDITQNKVYAILAYLGILFLVPLIVAKDSPYARYHTNQGVLLFLAGVIVNAMAIIPILGWIAAAVGNIILLVFKIIGMLNAFRGEAKPLPIFGHIEIIKA